jgi:hypothetical protein
MNRVNSIAVDSRQLTSVEVTSIPASVHDRHAKRSCWRAWGDREFGNGAETTGRADDNNNGLWIVVVAVLLTVYGILRIAGLVSLRTSGIRWPISPVPGLLGILARRGGSSQGWKVGPVAPAWLNWWFVGALVLAIGSGALYVCRLFRGRVRRQANDLSALLALGGRHNLIAVARVTRHLARDLFQRPLLVNTLPGVLGLQFGFNHRVGAHSSAARVQLGRNRGAA